MNPQQEQEFSNLILLISKWNDAYVCLSHSYVALKTSTGTQLLFGRIVLEPTRVGLVDAPFVFETEHVLAGRFLTSVRPEDIRAVWSATRLGEMQIAARDKLKLPTERQSSLSMYISPIYHPGISDGPRLPAVRIHGASAFNAMTAIGGDRNLDWELRASDTPFESMDELFVQVGLAPLAQMGGSTTLEVIAKSPAGLIDTSRIASGEALLECRTARRLSTKKCKIGYRIFRQDGAFDRGSASGDRFEWHEQDDVKIGSYRVPVGEATLMQAFLSYDGVSLHSWWITDPQQQLNPRNAIHQVFDENFDLLKKVLLKPDSGNAHLFEQAISALLNVLGFSVVNYGRIPKLQKGPDIIAITASGNVGVIECTVGLLDHDDKLGKLVQRTELIKQGMAAAGYGFVRFQPIIVTALSRREVATDLENAGKHGIAVVCREDIQALLNQVGLPPNADQYFANAEALVPNAE